MRMAALPLTTSTSSTSLPDEERAQVHGRVSLKMVISIDSTLLLYVLLTLLQSNFDGYDLFFLSLHLPHIFTVLLAYVVVQYSVHNVAALKILIAGYMIAIPFDFAVIVVRMLFLFHTTSVSAALAQALRGAFALTFLVIDVFGAVFAERSHAKAHLLALRIDEQFQALARHYASLEHRGTTLGDVQAQNSKSVSIV